MTARTTEIVERLLNESNQPLVSVYMPTHRAGTDIWQDPIRLKNLERTVEHDLELAGVSRKRIDAFLLPFAKLRDDRTFWQYQADGLALFASADGMEEFRLPCPVPELCMVGPHFHLKPLLMSLAGDQSFFVLALSQNAVRLFRGSLSGLRDVPGLNLPQGMETGATGSGKAPQGHSAGSGTLIPHSSELNHKGLIADYCRRIDHILTSVVGAGDLVILAAVDYIASIYRDTSSLRGLAANLIPGNPDNLGTSQLFEKALPIATDHFDRTRQEAEVRFFACLGTGKALDVPVEAIQAAREGRVDTLFVAVGVQIWGHFSADGTVCLSNGKGPLDQDLLNIALIDTWKSGGRVLAMTPEKMPGGRQIAAITRF